LLNLISTWTGGNISTVFITMLAQNLIGSLLVIVITILLGARYQHVQQERRLAYKVDITYSQEREEILDRAFDCDGLHDDHYLTTVEFLLSY
jgi:hypothetical protein